MASTDWRIPKTGVNVNLGGTNWTNPTSIAFNDGSAASIVLGNFVQGNILLSGLQNVGIDITASVIGMQVKVDLLVNQFDSVGIFLCADSALSKYSETQSITGGATGEITLGSATDLWLGAGSSVGYTGFTGAEVSTATFGVAVNPVPEGGTNTLQVDYVAIKLFISDQFDVSPVPSLGLGSC